jgi:hypothetical protein
LVKRRRVAGGRKGYAYIGTAVGLKASRRRRVLRVIVLAGVATVLVALGYGVSLLVDWARQSDVFVVSEIHVLGTRKLAASDVVAAAGIDAGENLLRISPHAVEDAVSALPEVKRAFVQKRLPDKLVIRIADRRPCFLVSCGCLWLVDREGAVLRRGGGRDVERLPMVAGLNVSAAGGSRGAAADEHKSTATRASTGQSKSPLHPDVEQTRSPAHLEPGVRLDRQGVDQVLEVIRVLENCSPDLAKRISEICRTPDGGLILFTSDPPHRVLLGRERPLAESLVVLGPVLDDLKRRGLVGMEVDLRFERQLVVRASKERVAMMGES